MARSVFVSFLLVFVILVLHRALPDLQRMKHKADQAFGHREVFCFPPSVSRAAASVRHDVRQLCGATHSPDGLASCDVYSRADATGSKLGNERCPDRQHAGRDHLDRSDLAIAITYPGWSALSCGQIDPL